jgi:MGT family glycosyltransferase
MVRWFLETVPQQVTDLRNAIAEWKPDVLVNDVPLFGATLILRETLDIPVAVLCVLIACPLPGPDAPPWGRGLPPPTTPARRLRAALESKAKDLLSTGFRREMNAVRARYGLAPIRVSAMAYTGKAPLFMVHGIPELDYSRHDLPDRVHYLGPCLWHRPSGEAAPEWIEALPRDRPVVHVTEGTIHSREPFVLRAAAQGLAGLNMRVVMTTGRHRDPADLRLGSAAGNVRVEKFVPHSDLLPRTDVVVTTGGAGTVLTALAAGVPLVVVPSGLDLPENAQRIVEAGVGVRLAPRDCTPEKLRRAVESVLRDAAYARKAKWIQSRLAEKKGPQGAVRLLTELVERRTA